VIRVLLADDEELVRTGLRLILGAEPDLSVVGEAANGREAVEKARSTEADVLLLDLRMPELDGLAVLRRLGDVPVAVVVLTTFDTDANVREALAAGAAGFLLKDTPPRQIAAAVRAVADGTASLSPAVTTTLIESYVERKAVPRRVEALRKVDGLSEREREVLVLLGSGGSNAELAKRLFVSEATVKTYVSRLLTKLDIANRTQAAILAHEAGLLEG
jgi:DNA-binding NarL/FixJ family response regulator